MSRADALGSKIASSSFKSITEPEAGAQSAAGTGSSDGTSPHAPVTAAEVIALAKKQVGISETDGYGGGTKYQRWYAGTERARETVARDGGSVDAYLNAAWCSMFISWLGHKLDFGDQMGSDAWTIAHAEWFKEQGRWGHKPKPGAVVFFSWSGGGGIYDIDHVGLVIKNLGDGRIKTVEGNTNDAVTKQVRSTGMVVGYGYPDYAG
ncbi:CHAP domain-containing protein [Actinomadura alba]|uniref:CHAP domain-containing protein n=2 Tax=Actinomadura alba TaxID=406431 RepID=A0ABR7LKI2_9ACTN|nr:CHAP domain-containing protein [Actinomadura alba]